MAWIFDASASHPLVLPDGGGGLYAGKFSFDATDPKVALIHTPTVAIEAVPDVTYIHAWILVNTKGFNSTNQGFWTLLTRSSSEQDICAFQLYHKSGVGLAAKFWYYDSVSGFLSADVADLGDTPRWIEFEYKYDRVNYVWEARIYDDTLYSQSGTFNGPGREPVDLVIGSAALQAGTTYTGTGTTEVYFENVVWDATQWYRTSSDGSDFTGSILTSYLAYQLGDVLYSNATLTGSVGITGEFTLTASASLSGSFTTNNIILSQQVSAASGTLTGSITTANITLEEDNERDGTASLSGSITTNNVYLKVTLAVTADVASVSSGEVFEVVLSFSELSEVVNLYKVKYDRHWVESGEDAWKGALEYQNLDSVTLLGTFEEVLELPWVTDSGMAEDVASFWAAFRGGRRIHPQIHSKWSSISYSIGTVLDLDDVPLLAAFPGKKYMITGVDHDTASEDRIIKATEFEFESE